MLHLANLLNSVSFLIFVSVYNLLFSAREQKAKVKWLIKNQGLNNDEILTLVAFISHSHFSIILSSCTFRDIIICSRDHPNKHANLDKTMLLRSQFWQFMI